MTVNTNSLKLLDWDNLLGSVWIKQNVWHSMQKTIHTSRRRNVELVVNHSPLGFVSITTLRKRYITLVKIIIWITIEIVYLIKKTLLQLYICLESILKAFKSFFFF